MSQYLYDVVVLTDDRYLNPKNTNQYINNVLQEDGLVVDSLREHSLRVNRVSWSDPNFDWSSTRYILFRSTWDYFERAEEWKKWLAMVGQKTEMINSHETVLWNMDKHYLQDLMLQGINIPQIRYIEIGEQVRLTDLVSAMNEDVVILKPCFSASARHTYKITGPVSTELERTFQELIKVEAMMLQPFQYSVPNQGEVSMMIMGGHFTHAVLKKPKQGDFRVQDDFGGSVTFYEPSKDEIKFAEAAVAACPSAPVYARVDIIEDNDGHLALIEIELIEPELWFRLKPKAAQLLASTIAHKTQ
jgi:glutathione synthase/RimK-type ligase-like ATP-grasp enzyme